MEQDSSIGEADDSTAKHLPECDALWQKIRTETEIIPCICDELRACEQRVRMEDDDYAYVAAQAEADGRRRGWTEALDAAREAVAAVQGPLYNVRNSDDAQRGWDAMSRHALAAIDALRDNND